jgi:hypothetical protein
MDKFKSISKNRKEAIIDTFIYADLDFFMRFTKDMSPIEREFSLFLITQTGPENAKKIMI